MGLSLTISRDIQRLFAFSLRRSLKTGDITKLSSFGASVFRHADYSDDRGTTLSKEAIMKLPLISMSVVAYTAMATAVICYTAL
jgi:hypothetical protein